MYIPDHIYLDKEVETAAFSQKILQKFPTIPKTILETRDVSIHTALRSSSLRAGKKILYLKNFQGEAIRICPGFTENAICCNYYVLDFIENCPLDCTYCILQAYLNRPVITLHVNVEEMLEKITQTIRAEPNRIFRVGTGEHSDSLALDELFELNPALVTHFGKLPNAILELKTKTDAIEPLLGLQHNGNTVVAWSLNPPEIIKREEFKTADLDRRLRAASTLIKEGYKVAFHFDPIIHYPDWKSGYQNTIRQLFETISPDKIAWISLGTLRYIPQLKKIAEARFSNLSLFCDEFIPAEDGKMRYFKPLRIEMLSSISQWITKNASQVPLYLCMEKASVWDKTMPSTPADHDALEKILTQPSSKT